MSKPNHSSKGGFSIKRFFGKVTQKAKKMSMMMLGKKDKALVSIDAIKPNFEIGERLNNIPLLRWLSDVERAKLGGVLESKTYKKGQVIIRQGDSGHEFFIVESGVAAVHVQDEPQRRSSNGEGESDDGDAQPQPADPPLAGEHALGRKIASLHASDYFGDASLLHDETRSASVVAETPMTCLTLDSDVFRALFNTKRFDVRFAKRQAISAEKMSEAQLQDARTKISKRSSTVKCRAAKTDGVKAMITSALESSILFADFETDQLNSLIDNMYPVKVETGDVIIRQGDTGEHFYVVESGRFDVLVQRNQAQHKVAEKSSGSFFGELALMYNCPRAATVCCAEQGQVWVVERVLFRRYLMDLATDELTEVERFLQHVPLFASLLRGEREAVAEALEHVSFDEEEPVVKQGESGDTFFIIRRGQAVVMQSDSDVVNGDGLSIQASNQKQVGVLHRGDYFGEQALINDEKRNSTVFALTKLECLKLDRQAFTLLLGPLTDILERNIVDRAKGEPNRAPTPFTGLRTDIAMADLVTLGTLGRGSFGDVKLVQHNHTGETFALKAISKQRICLERQEQHVQSERSVMAAIHSPWLVNLCCTFKDRRAVYFCMEKCLGGELFTVLRQRSVFNEKTAKFYAACVVQGFEYLHSRNIVYRDLKPENLMLDDKGFLKITDFGFAKVLSGRTFTMCGTPDYLSPEVIAGKGHGLGVDWWTLGILIFEMLASYAPFSEEDPMKTYEAIYKNRPVTFPSYFSREAQDIIKELLQNRPHRRLGVLKGGAARVKCHAWFRGFDWKALEARTMTPPIIPVVKNPADLSNFDNYAPISVFPEVPDGTGGNWDECF